MQIHGSRSAPIANLPDSSIGQPSLQTLVESSYAYLAEMARCCLAGERPGGSLQALDLVHETYLRLSGSPRLRWQSRAHFFAISARVMRRILVEQGRARRALKRGGSPRCEEFIKALSVPIRADPARVRLIDALDELAIVDHRKAQVVKMRFFDGLTATEIASAVRVSKDTVTRDLSLAKAWLGEHYWERSRRGPGKSRFLR